MIHKAMVRATKGAIIDEKDCPSLLAPIDISKPEKKK